MTKRKKEEEEEQEEEIPEPDEKPVKKNTLIKKPMVTKKLE